MTRDRAAGRRGGCPRLALAALLLLPTIARGQDVFTLHTIGPGVLVAEVVPHPSVYAFANSLIVIGADGVLVVDTQQSPSAARALIAEIARITPLPVRWVVNTHWHGDHVNGNQSYAAAFPDAEFIAHESVAEDMATLGAAARMRELAELPASVAARADWLTRGVGPDGVELTDSSRAAIARSLELRRAYLAELRALAPVPPTRTFRDRLTLRVGTREVVLIHAGPAHTRGDVMVLLPALGILAVGDLLEQGMPYFGDAAPHGWLEALRLIASLEPALFVPGHGRPRSDRTLLEDHVALLEAVLRGGPAEARYAAAPWPELEQRFLRHYGVSAPAFRAAVETAQARVRDAEPADTVLPIAPHVLVDGAFNGAEGIAFSGEGRMFVTGDRKLWEVLPDRTVRRVTDLGSTVGLAAIDARDVLVAEFGPLVRLTSGSNRDGVVLRVSPEGRVDTVASGLGDPNFILVRKDRTLLVSDDFTDEINRIAPDGAVAIFTRAVQYPNGMVESADGSALYVAQIFRRIDPIEQDDRLWRVPLVNGVPAGPPELVFRTGGAGGLDGLAMDEYGRIYIAANREGRLWRYDPSDGSAVVIAEDVPGIASLAFGAGAFDERAIYATQLRGGRIWKFDVGVRGMPVTR